jgi:fatty-acyl-CoA synthase
MEMHIATVWESIADAIGDTPTITNGGTTRTWAEFDDRAARLASAFTAAGLGPDSKVALYLYNSNEYQEAQYGVFKMRGVPINVNYRYLDEELRYLLDNSDAEAIVFHTSLGDRVARVVDQLPNMKLLIEVDDGPPGAGPGDEGDDADVDSEVPGAQRFEDVVSAHDPMERITRHEDDIYMLYTGGTTGMPKGVMYAMGGFTGGLVAAGFPLAGLTPPDDAADIAPLVAGLVDEGRQPVSIPCAPLMHGTGLWLGAFIPQFTGGHVVTLTNRSLDPHEVLDTVERHHATSLTIVGDTVAKTLIRALDEGKPDGSAYDTSSLGAIVSSGVMWTTEVKQQLIDRIEQVMLLDVMGSSEGSMGAQVTMKGLSTDTAKFDQAPTTKVFNELDQEVEPGSGEIGMVAAGGSVPLGYYKDEEKSASTFRVIDGTRYSFPGDLAQVAADGTLILLGRGSQVINTGGEKVYPEEVEESVKRVDAVVDCLVVGVDDERFGQAVTAVVSLADGASATESDIIASVKGDLAGFKAPKTVVFVPRVPRAPNGKADYKSARQFAQDPTAATATAATTTTNT